MHGVCHALPAANHGVDLDGLFVLQEDLKLGELTITAGGKQVRE